MQNECVCVFFSVAIFIEEKNGIIQKDYPFQWEKSLCGFNFIDRKIVFGKNETRRMCVLRKAVLETSNTHTYTKPYTTSQIYRLTLVYGFCDLHLHHQRHHSQWLNASIGTFPSDSYEKVKKIVENKR